MRQSRQLQFAISFKDFLLVELEDGSIDPSSKSTKNQVLELQVLELPCLDCKRK